MQKDANCGERKNHRQITRQYRSILLANFTLLLVVDDCPRQDFYQRKKDKRVANAC
jgi:hypothetical protein